MSYRAADIIKASEAAGYCKNGPWWRYGEGVDIWTNGFFLEVAQKPLPMFLQVMPWFVQPFGEGLDGLADYKYTRAKAKPINDACSTGAMAWVELASGVLHVRIQRPFYHYMRTRYPDVTFWLSKRNGPVRMRDSKGRLLGYIMPFFDFEL